VYLYLSVADVSLLISVQGSVQVAHWPQHKRECDIIVGENVN